jgi:hypothetical protein
VPDALVDGALELLVGDLDLEHDGAAIGFSDVGIHSVLVFDGWAGDAGRV